MEPNPQFSLVSSVLPMHYVPGHMVADTCEPQVDVWSLGCTLYEMLTAKGSMANKRNGVQRMNTTR